MRRGICRKYMHFIPNAESFEKISSLFFFFFPLSLSSFLSFLEISFLPFLLSFIGTLVESLGFSLFYSSLALWFHRRLHKEGESTTYVDLTLCLSMQREDLEAWIVMVALGVFLETGNSSCNSFLQI